LTVAALERGSVGRAFQLARLPRFDSVLLQRRLLPAWQLRVLRRRARFLVFDFDDAIGLRDSYDRRGPGSPRRSHRFRETVRMADTVIAGNDFLADCALRAGARPECVRVIPTCVATEHYTPRTEASRRSGVDLVWIGSSSTLRGIVHQKPLWDRLAREVPGTRLRLICDRSADLGAMPVVPVQWRRETEADALAEGDVGISWVPDDLWSRGKCGLKVLQYQAAGLPVLASPVGVHLDMIQPGATGWLPQSAEDWVSAVRTLASDPELRMRVGQAGRAAVEAGFSVAAWEATFVATLAGSAASTASQKSREPGRTAHKERLATPPRHRPKRPARSGAKGTETGGMIKANG
jgi:glycosyltransferase involved in cell wall biosynthesis